ncbi:MAG: hypothetical protein OXH22_05895 [Chloroflexi bacterium]|nr:hypothetical protein [Chloroflexota bacterium]
MFYFKGTVFQVVEVDKGIYDLRIDVSGPEAWESEIIYLWNYRGQRLLEYDIVEFVGKSIELYTYESVGAGFITIPLMQSISVNLIEG